MSEVYRFSESELLFFFMVLVRLSSFVVSWPVFGVDNVSQKLKILFALALAMVIFPTLKISPAQVEAMRENLILLAAREALIGLSMGYIARMFFFCFRMAGDLLGQAMGLSAAQVFNPMLGGQTSAVEQFYVTLASLFYLSMNGHHYLISGLVSSFDWVPAATMSLRTTHFAGLINITQEIIVLGLKFSAPVVISMLIINLVLGVIGKTVPQINVLVTSFPITVMASLCLMFITMPMLIDEMGPYLTLSTERAFQFVKAF